MAKFTQGLGGFGGAVVQIVQRWKNIFSRLIAGLSVIHGLFVFKGVHDLRLPADIAGLHLITAFARSRIMAPLNNLQGLVIHYYIWLKSIP